MLDYVVNLESFFLSSYENFSNKISHHIRATSVFQNIFGKLEKEPDSSHVGHASFEGSIIMKLVLQVFFNYYLLIFL